MVTLVRTTKLKAVEFDDLPNVQTTRDFQPLFDQRARPSFNFGGTGGPFGSRVQRKLGGARQPNGSSIDLAAMAHALHGTSLRLGSDLAE